MQAEKLSGIMKNAEKDANRVFDNLNDLGEKGGKERTRLMGELEDLCTQQRAPFQISNRIL